MIEILRFIFRDPSTWLGTVILVGVTLGSLSQFRLFTINRSVKVDKSNNKTANSHNREENE